MRLSHSDILRLNEAVVSMYYLVSTQGVVSAIMHTLSSLLGGSVSIAGLVQPQGAEISASDAVVFRAVQEIPIGTLQTHPRSTVPLGKVVALSDVMSRSAWHGRELYQACRPFFRVEDDLGVTFRCSDGRILDACIVRESRTFRPEDKFLLTLLLPHFRSLLELPGTPESPVVQGAIIGLGLTRREQEVLRWVAEGKTNLQISGILGIARGTVKIHLEHIFEKLGVDNRHRAARRALENLHPPHVKPR